MMDMVITVSKLELLDRLRASRERHAAVFTEALEGYARYARGRLEAELALFGEGKAPAVRLLLDRPESHVREYDRIIGMVEMHREDTFQLDEDAYRQYVDDDWGWKQSWLKVSGRYAPSSVASVYGVEES